MVHTSDVFESLSVNTEVSQPMLFRDGPKKLQFEMAHILRSSEGYDEENV